MTSQRNFLLSGSRQRSVSFSHPPFKPQPLPTFHLTLETTHTNTQDLRVLPSPFKFTTEGAVKTHWFSSQA